MRDRRRTPGWYVDPSSPELLRHWDGRTWASRRRTRPAWTYASIDLDADLTGVVAEGPVESTAVTTASEPALVVGPSGRRALGPTSGARPTRGWSAPSSSWGGSSVRSTGRPLTWGGPRRPLAVLGVVVVMALVVAAATTGLSRQLARPAVAAALAAALDQQCLSVFVSEPSAEVVPRAGAAGASGSGAAGSGTSAATTPLGGATSSQTATQVTQTVAQVQGVAAQLTRRAAGSTSAPAVDQWLAGWSRWSTEESAYATYLDSLPPGASPAIATAQPLLRSADLVANDADRFATDNGMADCTISERSASLVTLVPPPATSVPSPA